MIEQKIDTLIQSIDRLAAVTERLAAVLESPPSPEQIANIVQSAEPQAQPSQAQPTQASPETPVQASEGITKDSLQAYALKRVREEGKSFKAILVEALAKHGAKTISQLPDDTLPAVYAAIGGKA